MRKVIVIGLDGLSWDVLEELFSRGVMSNLNTLRRKGVCGELRSIIPPFTVPTWTSLTTGVNPGKHGAYSFLVPTENYGSRLIRSSDVKYPRVYEVCTMMGLNSVVINLPLSHPPVILKGTMISDWLYPRCEVFPNKVRTLTRDYAPPDPFWWERDPSGYVKSMLTGLESRLNVIERLFCKMGWSLFFVVFSETDFLLHKLYDDVMSGKGLAKEAYKVFNKIDDFVGRIVRNRPRGSLILLVSDHGFTKYRYTVYINKILQDAGLIKFKIVKRGTRPSKKTYVLKLFDKVITELEPARKVLSLLFQVVFGRTAVPIHAKILDTASSLACMHNVDQFGIYINAKDVFRNWLMESKEVEVTWNNIKEILSKVKNPHTGETIFERLHKREELFQGPYVKTFPHIIFFPKKEYWIHHAMKDNLIEEKPHPNHSLTGIFAACGEDVKHGVELNQVSIFDIAPTILHYLELPLPHDTDGRALSEIFKEDSEVEKRLIKKVNYLKRWNIIRKARLLSEDLINP